MRKLVINYAGKSLCLFLALCFLTVDVGLRTAHAGMISTETVLAAQTGDSERAQVNAFFARDDVRQSLMTHGLAADEVAARIAALSDVEITRIATELDRLPAGASFGTVIGAVLLVFVILLVTDVLGYTKIFTFVQPIR